MRITRFTDLALRLLTHLARHPDRRSAVAGVAAAYELSAAHLEKVASELARLGLVIATRGRNGGLRLARPAHDIGIGSVVRALESGDVAGCEGCRERARCRLPALLCEAFGAFYQTLDRYTIADLSAASEVDAAGGQPFDLGRLMGDVENRQRQLVA
ncbi:MAG: Rrf2 family transcriptional regulator [Alphaproteobacteria bacterium]|nr:Rrf2 family transcriptional regulator [Alphaproteobacteria bacterium]